MVYRRLTHLIPLPAKASAEFRLDISVIQYLYISDSM